MIVHILDPAKDDLAEGFWFYESRDQGLGHYFLDTIYTEIDKLKTTAGIHPMYEPPFFQLKQLSISAVIRNGSAND